MADITFKPYRRFRLALFLSFSNRSADQDPFFMFKKRVFSDECFMGWKKGGAGFFYR